MEIDDALEQLDAIHAQMARSVTYRGYRPGALAVSGVVGLMAAASQSWVIPPNEPLAFVRYWLLIALGCAAIAGGVTVLTYFTRDDEFSRRRTRTILGQFLPCLAVGAVLTVALGRLDGVGVTLLPGGWAMVFALGVVASLPLLPREAGWVAAWYFASGTVALLVAEGPVPSGWVVGLPFGGGQILAALVLLRACPAGAA